MHTQAIAMQYVNHIQVLQQRAAEALQSMEIHIGRVLHPSPASPVANRGWAEAATRQLVAQGVWD